MQRYDPTGAEQSGLSQEGPYADRGEGTRRPGDGRAARAGGAPLRAGGQAGQRAGRPAGRVLHRAQSLQPRLEHRGGDPAPQGRDAARGRALARPAARPQARLRGHGQAGQAPPRQAPRTARRQRCGAGLRERIDPRGSTAGSLVGRPAGGGPRPAGRGALSTTLRCMPRILDKALRLGEGRQFKQYAKRVEAINRFEPELELLEDDELRAQFDELRNRADNGESLDDLLPESFAITREVGRRTMGMRHFDVQLIGGMVLHSGAIAEMRTGEGKTLTATLAVVLNALARRGVHLVTVNDYLARRDAEWMSPIYSFLGLDVGILQNMQSYEDKQVAYAAPITS